jgi:hypothetical protein
MIKCNVNVCAEISRSAVVKENNGEEFFVYTVKLPVKGRNGEVKDLLISVSQDGGKGKAALFTEGRRVAIKGVLAVKKKDDKVYYNLRTTGEAELTKSSAEDNIEGTMEFIGKIGKKGAETREDKKGEKFKTFSAFSSDKNGDKTEFVWVSFLYFRPKEDESFLVAGKYINVSGDLQLNIFKDDIAMQCRVREIKEHVFAEKQ